MANTCRHLKNEIEAAETSADLSREAKSHLEICSGCRTVVERHVKLRLMIQGLDRVDAPGDFEFRLRARMASASRTNARRLSLGFTPGIVSVFFSQESLRSRSLARTSCDRNPRPARSRNPELLLKIGTQVRICRMAGFGFQAFVGEISG